MEFSHPPRSVSSERISSRRSQSFPLSNLRNNEILGEITGLTFVRFLSSSEPGYIFFHLLTHWIAFRKFDKTSAKRGRATCKLLCIYIYNVFCIYIYIYIYIYIILYNYDSSSFIRLPSESSCFFALCSASHWEQPSSHHTSSHMIPHDMISDINSTSTFFFFFLWRWYTLW